MTKSENNGGSHLPPTAARRTRRSVLIADAVANWTITVGGLGVILAVLGIMLFLVNVARPLFAGGRVVAEGEARLEGVTGLPLMLALDEHLTVLLSIDQAGIASMHHKTTGRLIARQPLDLAGRRITAFAHTLDGRDFALGLDDGSLRLGRIGAEASVLKAAGEPPGLELLGERDRTDGKAVFAPIIQEHDAGGARQWRRVGLTASLSPAQQIAAPGVPLVAVDYRLGGTVERPTRAFATLDGTGAARISNAEIKRNLLTGRETVAVTTSVLPRLPEPIQGARLLMTSQADQLYIAGRDGRVVRFDVRNRAAPVIAEIVRLLPEGEALTALGFLTGEQSIVSGGARGSIGVHTRLQRGDARSSDGYTLVAIHAPARHAAGVAAFVPGQRSKSFLTAEDGGAVWLRHATSEQTLLRLGPPAGAAVPPATSAGPGAALMLAFAPRDNGIARLAADGTLRHWTVSVPHPETTWSSIFGRVWYEGHEVPTFAWQSSSGTDSFEPKLSLVPLIFGTIKATVYSLLFAVPVALLAAVYTSEFLGHRGRALVKPSIEMMASLPSVVLGFIAALILAPIVESWIAAIVIGFVIVPLALFFGAYLWQLVPDDVAIRIGGPGKLALTGLALSAGVLLAVLLAAPLERLLFAGDFKSWVRRDAGSGAPLTMLLLWPLAFAAIAIADATGRLAPIRRLTDPLGSGRAELARWLAMLLTALAAALALALLLQAAGFDLRGGAVDTYEQRNTLVVGFAMGFAVIPIMYTIAEDAMAAVPEHLRAASLACGATPWQTALRVILPTALSGIFAAVMIGMGRAVGETMIVVMAAGNTPLIDWNVFNGFRALSANIAVELPEAVKDGTLYRMLFLAALTLFVMTFVLNTIAELVRLSFRKRTAQL